MLCRIMKRTQYAHSEIFPLDPTRSWPSPGGHARPFRSAIVIRLSRPSAESGRNKGTSQTSAKRVELASCPCSIGKVLHSSERGLALGVLGRRCCCTHLGLAAA